ncbi:MAG: hypothetical protein ABSB74_10085 [Tepidisphaeraceae bacterium]|jgi:hypothetical protein
MDKDKLIAALNNLGERDEDERNEARKGNQNASKDKKNEGGHFDPPRSKRKPLRTAAAKSAKVGPSTVKRGDTLASMALD